MFLKKLTLISFRNYTQDEFQFHPRLNILTGANRAGKTTILEAIYCLVLGRSSRTTMLREAVQWGKGAFSLQGVIENNQAEDESIKIILSSPPEKNEVKKEIFWQDKPLTNITELWRQIGLVYFSSEELYLIKGEPEIRRRMLNVLLSQLKPNYYFSYLRYQRSLRERNACLKRIVQNQSGVSELLAWDEGLIKTGEYLTTQRMMLVDKLSQEAGLNYPQISGGAEKLTIIYQPSIKSDFRQELTASRPQEMCLGTTLVGPHRDEVGFLLDGKSLKHFGSQGECRSAVLAVKLAEVEVFKQAKGWQPLVLFDDVFSELDKQRQDFFLRCLDHGFQCFITTTHLPSGWMDLNDPAKKIFQLEPQNVL
ncbi:MAG: DNA replication/repair protein RecF [Elusimicrobiota bacterium]